MLGQLGSTCSDFGHSTKYGPLCINMKHNAVYMMKYYQITIIKDITEIDLITGRFSFMGMSSHRICWPRLNQLIKYSRSGNSMDFSLTVSHPCHPSVKSRK